MNGIDRSSAGARKAAYEAVRGEFPEAEAYWINRYALDAAHNPSLGLDASVCLGHVVVHLREKSEQALHSGDPVAAFWYGMAAGDVEREFGGDAL